MLQATVSTAPQDQMATRQRTGIYRAEGTASERVMTGTKVRATDSHEAEEIAEEKGQATVYGGGQNQRRLAHWCNPVKGLNEDDADDNEVREIDYTTLISPPRKRPYTLVDRTPEKRRATLFTHTITLRSRYIDFVRDN